MGSVRRAVYIAPWIPGWRLDEGVAEAIVACNGDQGCVRSLGFAFTGDSIVRYEYANGVLVVEFDEKRLAANKWFGVAREYVGLGVRSFQARVSSVTGVDTVRDTLAAVRYAAAAYMLSWLDPVIADEVAETVGILLDRALRADGVETIRARGVANLTFGDVETTYAFETRLYTTVDVNEDRVRLGFKLVQPGVEHRTVTVTAVFEDGGVLTLEVSDGGPGGPFRLELDVPRGVNPSRYSELVSKILRLAPGFATWASSGTVPDLLEKLVEEHGGRITSVRKR